MSSTQDQTNSTSNINVAVKDFGSVGPLERFMHNVPAASLFLAKAPQCAQFVKVDEMSVPSEVPNWGGEVTVTIPSVADYIMSLVVEVEISRCQTRADTLREKYVVSFCGAPGVHLFECIELIVGENVVAKITPDILEIFTEYFIHETKRAGYMTMLGAQSGLRAMSGPKSNSLDAVRLTIPLPFFFSKCTTAALPTIMMSNKAVKLRFQVGKMASVYNVYNTASNKNSCIIPGLGVDNDDLAVANTYKALFAEPPVIKGLRVYSEHGVASTMERNNISCMERYVTYIDEYVPLACEDVTESIKSGAEATVNLDNVPGAIKSVFFGVKDRSYYGSAGAFRAGCPSVATGYTKNLGGAHEIIDRAAIYYGEEQRVPMASREFYTRMQPYRYAVRAPETPKGILMYSFAMHPAELKPSGSSDPSVANTSMSISFKPTEESKSEANRGSPSDKKYEFVAYALVTRLVRFSGGKFEVLDGTKQGFFTDFPKLQPTQRMETDDADDTVTQFGLHKKITVVVGGDVPANEASPNAKPAQAELNAPNGIAPNGTAPDAKPAQVENIAHNGAAAPVDNVAPNGIAPNGIVPNGIAPNGAAAPVDNIAPNGIVPNGVVPPVNNIVPNGIAPNGAAAPVVPAVPATLENIVQ